MILQPKDFALSFVDVDSGWSVNTKHHKKTAYYRVFWGLLYFCLIFGQIHPSPHSRYLSFDLVHIRYGDRSQNKVPNQSQLSKQNWNCLPSRASARIDILIDVYNFGYRGTQWNIVNI